MASRLAVLAFALLGAQGGAADSKPNATVTAESLEVFSEASPDANLTGQLPKGSRVIVRSAGKDGWSTIEMIPPLFGWVEAEALQTWSGTKGARVIPGRIEFRAGLSDARMPGPPLGFVTRGTELPLVARPRLVLGKGNGAKTWLAVRLPKGTLGYVRADGLAPIPGAPDPFAPATRDEGVHVTSDELPPPAVATELARIAETHRAILRAPIAQWSLETIRQRYNALSKTATDAASARVIRERLEMVERQEQMSADTRQIEAILARSRSRDHKLAQYLQKLSKSDLPKDRPYDAEGMVQSSSRTVDGQRVFALIGPEGTTVAYLDIPAGLDPSPFLSQQVGVRGNAHYDEHLRARLIAVDDLDPIEVAR